MMSLTVVEILSLMDELDRLTDKTRSPSSNSLHRCTTREVNRLSVEELKF